MSIHTITIISHDAGWKVTTEALEIVDHIGEEDVVVEYVDNLSAAIDIVRNVLARQGERP